VTRDDELWIPLVDEPIGAFVSEIQSEHQDIATAVESPRRLLAFRTFAYLRVGMLLGRLLIERDLEVDDGSPSWAELLLAEPDVREQAIAEIRAVAEELAADPVYAVDAPLGPDEAERRRFLEFAKRHLSNDAS
jgi:hypothetical protein